MTRTIRSAFSSQRLGGILLGVSIALATPAQAQWAVKEVHSTEMFLDQVKSTLHQAAQVENQYRQIQHQITAITHQVTNLQRFDLNYVQRLLTVGAGVSRTLKQARGVSFELDQATAEFDRLYPQVTQALGAGRVLSMRLDWLAQRRQAAYVGVQVQAITQSLDQSYQRLCELLQSAHAAKGNLDISQIQAQQQGVTQGILLQMQQMMAGSQRAETSRQAEEATLQEATLRAVEAAAHSEAEYTEARGKLMTYRW